MITVADIMSLPSIRHSELIAPCEGGGDRQVLNVGILDVGPDVNRYSAYMPDEFILTNQGFAVGDKELADESLLTMIGRNVAGIGIKTVYDPYVSERVRKASTRSGVPVFLYEGSYHEAVVYDALSAIHQDESDSEREGKIDSLIGDRSARTIRSALLEVAEATGSSLQCLAIARRSPEEDETSLHAALLSLRNLCAAHASAHDEIASEIACRYHDRLLIFVSRKVPPATGANGRDDIVEELRGFAQSVGPFVCGASEDVPLAEGDLAIRQALILVDKAIEQDESFVEWSDLGWRAFGAVAGEDRLFSRCCEFYQGRIVAADRKADLMATARAFMRLHGDVGAVAVELCQHPNTIRYRLKKLKSILGLDDATDRELVAFLGIVFLVD